MKQLILAFVLLASFKALAHNDAIDSLESLLKQDHPLSKRIELQCKLSQKYTEIGEFSVGGKLANEALVLASNSNDQKGKAFAYYSIARLHQYIGDFNKGLSYHYKALPIFEKEEAFEEIAWVYLNMGICFSNQRNPEKAVEHDRKALKIFNRIGHRQGEAYSYLNISLAVNELGDTDSAVFYMESAKTICEEIGDQRGLGYVYNSIADIYMQVGEYDKAIQGNLSCLLIREEENDKMDMSFCYANLGKIYLLKNDLEKAEDYLQKGKKMALAINARTNLRSIYYSLSKVSARQKNYKAAYQYFKKYEFYQRLLSNEENQRKAAELQFAYEQAQKDQEIDLIKEVSAKERFYFTIGVSLTGGGLIMVAVFLYMMAKRAKALRRQRNIIHQQKEQVDEQHKSITDSIVYAQKIQNALLTTENYISEHLNKEFFIYYQPKDIVSGDFYWAHEHKGAFYFITADCTGHGVPGAFMSLLNMSILNELVVERDISSPAEILNHQRTQIIKSLSAYGGTNSNDGMDCILCRFDLNDGRGPESLSFAAANNTLWIVRNNEIIKLKGDKMPVGAFVGEMAPFTEHKVELQKGDIVYTFSDGVTDQFGGEKDKKFKPKRLADLLLSVNHLSMDEQRFILMRTIETWMGDQEQTDDILFIGVKI